MSERRQTPLMEVSGLCKRYAAADEPMLRDVAFQAWPGETIALLGPSGCGKTTLLNLLGLLDQPSAGQILFDGQPLAQIRPRHVFRAQHLGFVFQFHHLLPTMTLFENVQAPLLPAGVGAARRQALARQALAHVGLTHKSDCLPARLSGGECQRAALARALVNHPRLILADEPTGNLDSGNGRLVMDLLLQHAQQHQALVMVATHNPALAQAMQRQFHLLDGRLTAALPPSPAA